MKILKTTSILIACLAVVVLFSGCTNENSDVIDCGDIGFQYNDCVSNALKTCSPAKWESSAVNTQVFLKGLVDGKCVMESHVPGFILTCNWPEEIYSTGVLPSDAGTYCTTATV